MLLSGHTKMISTGYSALVLFAVISSAFAGNRQLFKDASEFLSVASHQPKSGTHWAVLVAGSNGWENYRHQADVCHAYQTLKKGGLKDENIVVFMYDDIASNSENPRPGVIINNPNGSDVYHGVPKDYTGKHCTAKNFLAVLSGDKSAVTGGSGKVVNSGPDDYIFIYYADHGSPGLVGMPSGDDLYANELIETLKKKRAANAYKKMVIYLEACEAGSMFDGLLPDNINIYAVTASNPDESSYAYYCPGQFQDASKDYDTCLGDLFSISWLEDRDLHDAGNETLAMQYRQVKKRTLNDNKGDGSHVMRYGDLKISKDFLETFMGITPASDDSSLSETSTATPITLGNAVPQRDVELLHFKHKFDKAPEGSVEKKEAQEKLETVMAHRTHVDATIAQIAKAMFGESKSDSILKLVRPQGQPVVDDWGCLKSMVKVYENYCGPLGWYGRQYARALANMCNAGATVEEMSGSAALACP